MIITCKHCGENYEIVNWHKPVKYPYCKKSRCQTERNREIYKNRRAREGKPKVKSRARVCTSCGDKFKLGRKQHTLKYCYCLKPECQKQRAVDHKRRNMEAGRVFRSKVSKSRLKHAPQTTGKPCVDCSKPVKIEYPSAAHAGIWNVRCKTCRDKRANTVQRLDGDYLFLADVYYEEGEKVCEG